MCYTCIVEGSSDFYIANIQPLFIPIAQPSTASQRIDSGFMFMVNKMAYKRIVSEKAKEYKKQWFKKKYAENPDVYKEKYRVYYANNKEDKNKATTEYREQHPDLTRRVHYKAKYGITICDYQNMVHDQDNKCAICGKESEKRLQVDHDHTTGKVRGLLCGKCNRGLGNYDENIENLLSAIEYLKYFEKNNA